MGNATAALIIPHPVGHISTTIVHDAVLVLLLLWLPVTDDDVDDEDPALEDSPEATKRATVHSRQ